tara:strand:- start:164 stop:490 length:327 start_codon:yes stop_codon:yes gene_type:complete
MNSIKKSSFSALFVSLFVIGSMLIQPLAESIKLFENPDVVLTDLSFEEKCNDKKGSEKRGNENNKEEFFLMSLKFTFCLPFKKSPIYYAQHPSLNFVIETQFPPPELI